jgi:tRNA nucleotidyltransferase (CCA-adding enzyme)
LSAKLANQIESASRIWHGLSALSTAKPSKVVAMLDETTPLTLFTLYYCNEDPLIREKIEEYVDHWRHVSPFTNGYDLKIRGLAPGPIYRTILARLRSAWLDGEISSQHAETDLLNQLLENSSRLE